MLPSYGHRLPLAELRLNPNFLFPPYHITSSSDDSSPFSVSRGINPFLQVLSQDVLSHTENTHLLLIPSSHKLFEVSSCLALCQQTMMFLPLASVEEVWKIPDGRQL